MDEYARAASRSPTREALQGKGTDKVDFTSLDIPLAFMVEDPGTLERAATIARRQVPRLRQRWSPWGLDEPTIFATWKEWVRVSYGWLNNVYPMMGRKLPYANVLPGAGM